MEVLTLNGKQYVKASKAAKDLGYASDYVGQLCRSGTVDAHLVGRTWYVNPDTLGAHRVEKRRNARTKAREYAQKAIKESREVTVNTNTNAYRNIAIRYQGDGSDLVPPVKKVHIASEEFIAERNESDSESDSYEVLNKDKKIIMSGRIPVYDAEEETALTDTTILSPRIVKQHAIKTKLESTRSEIQIDQSEKVEKHAEAIPFVEKLSKLTSEESLSTTGSEEVEEEQEGDVLVARRFSFIALLSSLVIPIAFIVTVIALSTVFMEQKSTYSEGILQTSIVFDTSEVLKYIEK